MTLLGGTNLEFAVAPVSPAFCIWLLRSIEENLTKSESLGVRSVCEFEPNSSCGAGRDRVLIDAGTLLDYELLYRSPFTWRIWISNLDLARDIAGL